MLQGLGILGPDTGAEWRKGSEVGAMMEVKGGVQVLIGGNLKGHKGSHLGLVSNRRRGFEGSFIGKCGAKASFDRCF